MATTTKQNNQFYANGPSIDANIGPWASVSAYETWLTDEIGLEAPYEGTEILVKNASTGKITKYRYEVVSGSAVWTEENSSSEYKGIVAECETLHNVTDYGFYFLRGTYLKGFLSISFDYNFCVTQHLLANQRPVYENGEITSYVTGASFLSRLYTNGAWTEWVDAAATAQAAATAAQTAASTASDAATSAGTAASTAADALTTIRTAIEGLDPSTSTEDAIVALTARMAALETDVVFHTDGTTTYNDY